MEKINFVNNVTKASAETFNTMQDNIEDAINDVDDKVDIIEDDILPLKPKILYNNSEGSNGTITLSDDINNYNYIEIYYKSNDNYYGYKKVIAQNCEVDLVSFQPNMSNTTDYYMKMRCITINNNSISTKVDNNIGYYKEINHTISGQTTFGNNSMYITKVIGY